jgi:NAD(P)-dependent dehydrogenase (short-subunit alcohol dehydrogenase family)
MLTKCLAQELERYQIGVNAVNPLFVKSNPQIAAGVVDDDEECLKRRAPLHPPGRTGISEDAAGMLPVLLWEEASWITGAIISVDGGRTI